MKPPCACSTGAPTGLADVPGASPTLPVGDSLRHPHAAGGRLTHRAEGHTPGDWFPIAPLPAETIRQVESTPEDGRSPPRGTVRAVTLQEFVQMANPDRLTGLDSSFLHLERNGAHMHVAACAIFEGDPPAHQELMDALESRLHLVPRYRQRLAFVPFDQGRPVWVDDPHFKASYHVRHTALPRPGGEQELKRLAGRVFSQPLDRKRPLWELWLVEGLADNRFAVLSKTHHALVDGVSGVDIATVLFDTSPRPMPVAASEHDWIPRPLPSDAQLLADALLERAIFPREIARGVRAAFRGPRTVARKTTEALVALGALAWAGLQPAPPSPFNVKIGPHRRFTWVRGDLADFKAIKNALGGTVN